MNSGMECSGAVKIKHFDVNNSAVICFRWKQVTLFSNKK
uniref:Uncharacterized protein n=1 Tax=Arundo donax TaxID=35708 RepID=A0A0A9A2D8_ARUDO